MSAMQQPHDLLIMDARVLHCAEGSIEHADILIDNGRIAELAPRRTVSPASAADRIDASSGLVMPGLVNAHTHSPENLARGRAERTRLPEWREAIWPTLDALTADHLTIAIEIGAAEMIRRGVTGMVDHFRQTPMREDAIAAAIDTYAKIGMRTTLAVMLRDGGNSNGALPGASHVKAVPSAEEQIALVSTAQRQARERGVVIAFGPSAPHRCSDLMLERLAALDNSALIHTHLDETAQDAGEARARFGQSSVLQLDRLGLLGPRTTCAHAVHVTEMDIERLAATRTAVVHNPVSNSRLGSGIAPLPALLAARVPVALGTDGAASNDTQDLWEALKLAALLPRLNGSPPSSWPPATNLLDMATRQGHCATGLALDAPSAGTIAVGAPADLIIFDDDPLAFQSDAAPAASLVFGVRSEPRHVIARGRILMRDHVLATIDEADLRDRLRSCRKELAA
jgi:5-methylthioadenosine/S-adenosylhomocysteine deaminase